MSTLLRGSDRRKANAFKVAGRLAPFGAIAGATASVSAGAFVLSVLIVSVLAAYLVTVILLLAIRHPEVVLEVLALFLGGRGGLRRPPRSPRPARPPRDGDDP
jgi:hypothetical protein